VRDGGDRDTLAALVGFINQTIQVCLRNRAHMFQRDE
jgi:hypothetical protein